MSSRRKDERRTIKSMTDFRGNTIHVGDKIVFPRASGHCVEVVEAEVLEIFQTKGRDWSGNEAWATRCGVKPIKNSRFKYWGDKPERVTIQNTENVTLVV